MKAIRKKPWMPLRQLHGALATDDTPLLLPNRMDGNRFFNHHVRSVKFYFMKIFLFCLFLIGNLPAQTPNI